MDISSIVMRCLIGLCESDMTDVVVVVVVVDGFGRGRLP